MVNRMNRRSSDMESYTKAMVRTVSLDLPFATVLTNPKQEWTRVASGPGRMRLAHQMTVDWKEFTTDKYLFSHATIVASVDTEANGYHIKPACSELVNSNGNAWTNKVLLATFKSFIGGENYLEHVQVPELSKGKLLDAVLRPLEYVDSKGQKANIYYCDILVATNRKHKDLVKSIANGELTTMSMGCGIAGTPVLMSDGTTKNVENVVVGDLVFTHTGGTAEVESTRVRQTVKNELRRLSITGIPDTFVTEEHPYWTLIGNDVCIGCGKEMARSTSKPWGLSQIMHPWCSSSCKQKHQNSNKKCVSGFNPHEQHAKFDWVEVKNLRKGDYVAVPLGRKNKKREKLEVYKARLLGYYAAEGNLQRDSNGRIRAVEFSLHETEPIGDELIELAKEWGVAEDKIYSQIRIRESGRSRRIVIHDVGMASWLFDTCFEHCESKKFKSWVMDLDDTSVLNILGAYINGDGHCRKDSGRFSTVSCSRELSEQVLNMMMMMNIPANISKRVPKKIRKTSWTVNVRKGFADILNGYTFKFVEQQENKSKVSMLDGYMLRRVVSNSPVELICNVYNIHVKNENGDHSYIMNGVAVHNCTADFVQCSHCGKVLGDGQDNCYHLDHELGGKFVDKNGVLRVTAELCGRSILGPDGNMVGDPKSVTFIEASWVKHPAFTGAVLNHYVSDISDLKKASKYASWTTKKLEFAMEDIFKMRVADKNGMLCLRVAQQEVARRMREDRIGKIVGRIV